MILALLARYARQFLNQYNPSIRRILHSFIDSKFFDKCLQEYTNDLTHHIEIYEELDYFDFCYFCNKTRLDVKFKEFMNSDCIANNKYINRQITPQSLADSISFLFANVSSHEWIQHDKKWVMQYLHNLDAGLDLELDFLEWLISTNTDPIDFRKIPIKSFVSLAERYRLATNKSPVDVKKLIKSFKQSDVLALFQKIMVVTPQKRIKHAKDLGYIIDRYQDKNIPFKCFIVPRQESFMDYEELITNRWDDLHHLSKNYLDIYYAETDYGRSGYEIINQMNYIPNHLKTKAPTIIIWENDMSKAQGVDINRLDNDDVVDVVECIVNCIRENKTFDVIIKEANVMSDKLREAHRAVTNNNISISGGTITGNVAAENNGFMYSSESQSQDTLKLMNELKAVKKIIQDFTELNDYQKSRLNSIVEDSMKAIKTNSEEKKEQSKKRFKDALLFLGTMGSKLVSALSDFAQVITFFGLSPFNPV